MKIILALLALLLGSPARADVAGDFQTRVRSELIKPFALDLGGVLGAASVDTGRSWGFPGFEAGVVSGLQFRPDKNDLILRDSRVSAFGIPLLQVGVGLPFNTSLVAHGMKVSGVTVIGGGARFSLFKAPIVGAALPTAGISLFADKVTHAAFSGQHYAANVSVGWALPLITPFASAGYDLTKVEVRAANVPGLAGQSAWARGSRFEAGADITPLPLLRLRAAYAMIHGIPGATLGLLFKF
jgi:hypothetical protein